MKYGKIDKRGREGRRGKEVLFIIFLAWHTMTGLPAAGNNLIDDPSFENITVLTDDSAPWRTVAFNTDPEFTEYRLEKGNAHGGENYVKIINKKENHARIVQQVQVEPGKIYRLSCWIKTEDVGTESKGANITVENIIEYSPSITSTSTHWVYSEMYIKIGREINSIDIAVSLGGYYGVNTGTAMFDDITMEEVKKIPQGGVTGVKGELVEEEKELPGESKKKEIPETKKEPLRIFRNTTPLTPPVIIALVLGALCAVFVIARIIFINRQKKGLTGE